MMHHLRMNIEMRKAMNKRAIIAITSSGIKLARELRDRGQAKRSCSNSY